MTFSRNMLHGKNTNHLHDDHSASWPLTFQTPNSSIQPTWVVPHLYVRPCDIRRGGVTEHQLNRCWVVFSVDIAWRHGQWLTGPVVGVVQFQSPSFKQLCLFWRKCFPVGLWNQVYHQYWSIFINNCPCVDLIRTRTLICPTWENMTICRHVNHLQQLWLRPTVGSFS